MSDIDDPAWGCDVPISMPVPVEIAAHEAFADMGSHVFTESGLRIAINRATAEEIYAPLYGPSPGVD